MNRLLFTLLLLPILAQTPHLSGSNPDRLRMPLAELWTMPSGKIL